MQEVVVVNRNPHTVEDGYLGMKWRFGPGEKVTIPLAAAVHIFGYGITNAETLAQKYRRFGKKVEEGERFFKNFDFTVIDLVPQEVVAESDQLKVVIENLEKKLKSSEEEARATKVQLEESVKLLKAMQDENAELQKQVEQLVEK